MHTPSSRANALREGDKKQIKKITDLPIDVLKHHLFPMLDAATAGQLTQTSRYSHRLFKEQLSVTCLLQHVARGEQNQAKAILEKDACLLLKKGQVTDYSGRTFHSITAFQYALWALDRHMWTMLLPFFDKLNKRDEAAKQLVELESKGTPHGKHYDFSPLITAIQAYINEDFAYNEIGKAQCHVPAHVANEYCRPDRTFYPCPSFKDNYLPRTFSFHHYNLVNRCIISKVISWYPLAIRRGRELGIFRHKFKVASGYWDGLAALNNIDLKAISTLYQVRTQELNDLKEELNLSLTLSSLQESSRTRSL